MTTVACDSASPQSPRNTETRAHIDECMCCREGGDKEREVMEVKEEKEVMKPGEHFKIP